MPKSDATTTAPQVINKNTLPSFSRGLSCVKIAKNIAKISKYDNKITSLPSVLTLTKEKLPKTLIRKLNNFRGISNMYIAYCDKSGNNIEIQAIKMEQNKTIVNNGDSTILNNGEKTTHTNKN